MCCWSFDNAIPNCLTTWRTFGRSSFAPPPRSMLMWSGNRFTSFSPQGVTGILSIAESHISIHTWPEHGYAAADIFTCGDQTMPERAADYIVAALACRDPQITLVRRGLSDTHLADLPSAHLVS